MKLSYFLQRLKRQIGCYKSIALISFLVTITNSAFVFAQELGQDVYIKDRSSDRLKELDAGFKMFQGQVGNGAQTILNERDADLVDNALRYRPYYQDSIQLMTSACNHYNSLVQVDEFEIDLAYLADLLEASVRAEYEGKEEFLEIAYSELSTTAKDEFNRMVDLNADHIAKRKSVSFDYQTFAQESSRDVFLEKVSTVCERLPAVVKMFPAHGYIDIKETVIDTTKSKTEVN